MDILEICIKITQLSFHQQFVSRLPLENQYPLPKQMIDVQWRKKQSLAPTSQLVGSTACSSAYIKMDQDFNASYDTELFFLRLHLQKIHDEIQITNTRTPHLIQGACYALPCGKTETSCLLMKFGENERQREELGWGFIIMCRYGYEKEL